MGLPKPVQPSCLVPATAPRSPVAFDPLQDPFTHHDTTRIPLSFSDEVSSSLPFLNSSSPMCLMVCTTRFQVSLQGIHPSQRGTRTLQSHSRPCSSACSGSPHSAQKPFHYPNSWQHLSHCPVWLFLQWAKLWASLTPQAAPLWPHHTVQPPWTPGLSTEGLCENS